MKQLYRCDLVVIASFVGTEYTSSEWGWLLGRRGCGITRHYPFYPIDIAKELNRTPVLDKI
jgi:hypothetical protein